MIITNTHEEQAHNLANIIDILATTDIPQIRYDLARWDWEDEDVKSLVGKCVLGVIQCEVGDKITEDNVSNFNFEAILVSAGLEAELIEGGYPNILTRSITVDKDSNIDKRTSVLVCDGFSSIPDENGNDTDGHDGLNLAQLLYGLNDSGLSFQEIAEFLDITFGDRV